MVIGNVLLCLFFGMYCYAARLLLYHLNYNLLPHHVDAAACFSTHLLFLSCYDVRL